MRRSCCKRRTGNRFRKGSRPERNKNRQVKQEERGDHASRSTDLPVWRGTWEVGEGKPWRICTRRFLQTHPRSTAERSQWPMVARLAGRSGAHPMPTPSRLDWTRARTRRPQAPPGLAHWCLRPLSACLGQGGEATSDGWISQWWMAQRLAQSSKSGLVRPCPRKYH